MNKKIIATSFVFALAVFYFSKIGFRFGILAQTLTACLSFMLLYIAGKDGWQRFYLVFLTSFSSAVALGCSFFNPTVVTGPFVTDLRLSPFLILCISAFIGVIAMYCYQQSKSDNRFGAILLSVFIFNWIILCINVRFFEESKLENFSTLPFVILTYITHRWFKLSNTSYGLIFVYTMLHIYGSHYTYSEVPFGFWMQDMWDMTRNHYDRIVHFSFGLLLAYPIREMTIRISSAKGFWGYWFPIEFVLAFSCLYEIIEWLIVELFGGDLGMAYLGTQGDIWDAQKDMLLAGVGATITMCVVALIMLYYRRGDFWREFKESLRVKQTRVLGEQMFKEFEKQ